ncbi:hypothetical protein Cgig2_000121 [Carnegiea gigantea]|uniref:Uncharacterized protein n=1 Tax=Carnegiea gigantea TaxID=171969 RepID=A0A9Q1QS65_9CARY|nr:hypothetical protein Cgig2_000121 [Carnegiea gigantea]
MDRYLVPVEDSTANPKPIRGPRWKRAAIELSGRIESKYRREMSGLLIQSYSEIGVFPHRYHIDGEACLTHISHGIPSASLDYDGTSRRYGVSALEFDNQVPQPFHTASQTLVRNGIYLASVTKTGCLTVHDFESLYCQSNVISPCKADFYSCNVLQIACSSLKSSEIHIFDVAYVSSDPVEVLRRRPVVTIHGSNIHKGFSDVMFTSSGDSRVFACDTYGSINIWDRRLGSFPSMELSTNSHNALNSMQLDGENHRSSASLSQDISVACHAGAACACIIYGAGKQGVIYLWDLRGGRTSAAFQSHREAYHPPHTLVKLSCLLEKIGSLKAQSDIVPKDIHSISLDPSCADRLAFHLDDGWSGILDISRLEVTHIHCPPPAWLTGLSMYSSLSYLRKPSWLSTNSIYAVASSSDKGLYLLDFCPGASSPCHVDYSEAVMNPYRRNGFVPTCQDVTACAAHPLNGFIVVGTKEASLLLIGQRRKSWLGDEDPRSSEILPEDKQSSCLV